MTFLRVIKAGVVLVILLILQLELFASIRFFGVIRNHGTFITKRT